jgi:hypothetical protein
MINAFIRTLGAIVLGIAFFTVGFSIGRHENASAQTQPSPTPPMGNSVPGGFHLTGNGEVLQAMSSTTAEGPSRVGPCVTKKTCHFQMHFYKSTGLAFQGHCPQHSTCVRLSTKTALGQENGNPPETIPASLTLVLQP